MSYSYNDKPLIIWQKKVVTSVHEVPVADDISQEEDKSMVGKVDVRLEKIGYNMFAKTNI